MQKKILLLTLSLFFFGLSFCQNNTGVSDDELAKLRAYEIIYLFKNKKYSEIAKKIKYPLKRLSPIPPIKGPTEFVNKFEGIFDSTLVNLIINSNPEKDWGGLGWQGIMFNRGKLWMDYDGKIKTINYTSQYEKELSAKLISKDKDYIYDALNNYKSIVIIAKTESHLFRVDRLGDDSFRYSAWSTDKKMNQKPDIILYKGNMQIEGTARNESITFRNGNYTYVVSIIVLGKYGTYNNPDVSLLVYKGNSKIFEQHAKKLIVY